MTSRRIKIVGTILVLVVAALVANPLAAQATSQQQQDRTLSLIVWDPLGDHTGDNIDVKIMLMVYDRVTGAYKITLISSPRDPFIGEFRININLFNPDTGSTAKYPSFFADVLNDYDLSSPQCMIRLEGVDDRLTQWDIGDRVFTNSLEGTGNPDGTSLFRSAVSEFPVEFLTNEDFIAFADTAQPAIIQAW